ncbi:MAG: FtsX-like permease family protein [bacterium]|nr:FtsX-like permease family protein [bacterium]
MQLSSYARLVVKNARRSRTRLVATLGGCALAALIMSVCMVVDTTLRGVEERAEAQPNLIVHRRGRHCLATSEVPDVVAERIAGVAGVALAMPVVYLETPCQSATDVTVVHGVDKGLFMEFRAFSVEPGALEEFRRVRTAALVGERIAARYGWRPGQFVTMQELRGISFTIAGIFTTHGSIYDSVILLGREFLQDTLDKRGTSNMVLVKPAEGVDVRALGARIDGLPLPVPVQTQTEEAHLSTALAQLGDLIEVSRVVQGAVAFLMLIAMGNGVAMAMRDRTREFGVLRTLGYRGDQIAGLVLGEILMLALAGGMVGCAITQGLVVAGVLDSVSACGFTVSLRMGVREWLMCMGVIAGVAAVSGAAPAWRAGHVDVVSTIRKGD